MSFDQTVDSRDEIKLALEYAIKGPPEFKPDEKVKYLGQLRERVILALTKDQVKEPIIYDEVRKAISDQRSSILILNGDVGVKNVLKYEDIAQAAGKSYTTIHDPDLKGNLGLVVASEDPVDIEDIYVHRH